MSNGRAVVSLSLDSTDREDAGNWTCTAQVYEDITTGLTVGAPVERTIQLLVVGEPLSKVVQSCLYVLYTCVHTQRATLHCRIIIMDLFCFSYTVLVNADILSLTVNTH